MLISREGVTDEGKTRQGVDDQSHGQGSVLGSQLGQRRVGSVHMWLSRKWTSLENPVEAGIRDPVGPGT